jgi:hypothetical protein
MEASIHRIARTFETPKMHLNLVYKFNLRLNDRLFPIQPSYVERFRELVQTSSADTKVVPHLGAGRIDLEESLRSRGSLSRMVTLDKSLGSFAEQFQLASSLRRCRISAVSLEYSRPYRF